MDIIEKAIMKEMKQVFDKNESVNLQVQLNELEVISYFDKTYPFTSRPKVQFKRRIHGETKFSTKAIFDLYSGYWRFEESSFSAHEMENKRRDRKRIHKS
mgnify:CR=1 FL=1